MFILIGMDFFTFFNHMVYFKQVYIYYFTMALIQLSIANFLKPVNSVICPDNDVPLNIICTVRNDILGRVGKRRRLHRQFKCEGKCGKMNCDYVTAYKNDFDGHIRTVKLPCPDCHRQYQHKKSLNEHRRRMHGLPSIRPYRPHLKVPSEWPRDIFIFTKAMVRNCIQNDIKQGEKPCTKFKLTDIDKVKLATMSSNECRFNLTVQILKVMKQRGMLTSGNVTDDCGGFLRNGFCFQEHGGLFKLSLDRIHNNNGPHYMTHFPDINNVMSNIRLIPLAMNIRGGDCDYTVKDIQKEYHSTINPHPGLSEILEYEQKIYKTGKQKHSRRTLSAAAESIHRRDAKCREHFQTYGDLWLWARDHLEKIGAKCEISHINLRTNKHNSAEGMGFFQMSIDAINSAEGHVPGNMRIICRFLNGQDNSKMKQAHYNDDPETSWNTELFKEYFRIE